MSNNTEPSRGRMVMTAYTEAPRWRTGSFLQEFLKGRVLYRVTEQEFVQQKAFFKTSFAYVVEGDTVAVQAFMKRLRVLFPDTIIATEKFTAGYEQKS